MAEEEVPGGVPLYYAEFWVRVYDLPSDLITQNCVEGPKEFFNSLLLVEIVEIINSTKVEEFHLEGVQGLATIKIRLNQRGLQVDQICVLCGQAEDSVHTLLKCPLAVDCWKLIRVDSSRIVYTEFGSWFFSLFQQSNSECIAKFCAVAWRLWGSRNQLIRNQKSFTAVQIVQHGISYLNNWLAVRTDKASGFATPNMNSRGSGWHPGLRPPKFAEAVALRHTLQWLSVQQYSNVQLEIDSKEVLFGVMSAEEDFLEWGLIMADCK
ncbi:hypothetical protein GH714_032915 [Hevea brasiliensis]|uniref:Reverse transcriptase zinc-binding domain-containing protein n=1 Tax=Hevea brasiliensis TaxID=3981 RepID=A0A6A6LL36_HEVBR|nr:hypothetical protein GH714_032915 [Hevea brasiliensis]